MSLADLGQPEATKWDQFKAWTDTVEPADVDAIREIRVDSTGITVTRYQEDGAGRRACVRMTNQVLTTTEEIPFRD